MGKKEFKICDQCGGKMNPQEITKEFHFRGKEIELKGIQGFVCEQCGSIVFGNDEAQMIDRLVRAINTQPIDDILNLEETAAYLRVSNQTVYNMIRDGRIKAHKVGREWRFLRGDIIAYMDSASSTGSLSMAAKGGKIDSNDAALIQQEIEKRKADHD